MRSLPCQRVHKDCGFVAWGADDRAVLQALTEHLGTVHGVTRPTKAVQARLKRAVRAA